jgi:hypothetical protein
MTKLPSPQRRPLATQHPKRLRPKTYSVAVYLVGFIILGQVVAVISIFWLRAMVVPVRTGMPQPLSGQSGTTLAPPIIGPTPPPLIPRKPDLPSLPSLSTSILHPTLLSVPAISDDQAQVRDLNDDAATYTRKNDLRSAADTLAKSEDIDPRNPNTLKSLADTYYLMNNPEQAKIYWQRLVDLGPGVENLYALAKDHVLLLDSSHDADTLRAASNLPRTIFIDSVEKTPIQILSGQPQFHLRAVLMRKDPKMAQFDQKKLRPYVIFYQKMPDGKLVPDLNQHGGSFEDTFLFWSGKLGEPFGVNYLMPVPGALGPNKTVMGKFYGFVIGIYYDHVLQDARSEPTDLISRIQLPTEIE